MSTATDTLQIAKLLKNSEFSEKQAEAIAVVVQKIDDKNREELVTKDYFRAQLYLALLLHGLATVGALLAASRVL